MKKTAAMLLALVMILSLSACGGQAGSSEPPAAQSSFVGSTSLSPAGSAEPSAKPAAQMDSKVADFYLQKANEVKLTDTAVTFTDDSGRGELTIQKNPQNVAVLYGSLACLWYEAGGTVQAAIGGKNSIELYNEQIGRDFTQDEGVTVVAQSSSGTSWDVETILAAKPDLIVCSVGMKGYETIGGPAEAAGIPVIAIDYDSVQDYLKWFKVFCNLNGHPELWESIADATAQEIINIVSSVPKVDKAPTCVVLVAPTGAIKAYTGASQPGVIIKELGGVNLADPDSTGKNSSLEISLEDIYAMDPDIIFVAEFGEPGFTMSELERLVGDNPVWRGLRAITEGHMYTLDKSLYHNKANQRYNEAYLTMAKLLYPGHEF